MRGERVVLAGMPAQTFPLCRAAWATWSENHGESYAPRTADAGGGMGHAFLNKSREILVR